MRVDATFRKAALLLVDNISQAKTKKRNTGPTGQVILVFTDVWGLHAMWDRNSDSLKESLRLYYHVVRRHCARCSGFEVRQESDAAFFHTFSTLQHAMDFSLSVQSDVLQCEWPDELLQHPEAQVEHDAQGKVIFKGLRVRIALNIGEPKCEPDPATGRTDYFGPVVKRAQRLVLSARGGEILVAKAAADIIKHDSPIPQSQYVLIPRGPIRVKGTQQQEVAHTLLPAVLRSRKFAPLEDDEPDPFARSNMINKSMDTWLSQVKSNQSRIEKSRSLVRELDHSRSALEQLNEEIVQQKKLHQVREEEVLMLRESMATLQQRMLEIQAELEVYKAGEFRVTSPALRNIAEKAGTMPHLNMPPDTSAGFARHLSEVAAHAKTVPRCPVCGAPTTRGRYSPSQQTVTININRVTSEPLPMLEQTQPVTLLRDSPVEQGMQTEELDTFETTCQTDISFEQMKAMYQAYERFKQKVSAKFVSAVHSTHPHPTTNPTNTPHTQETAQELEEFEHEEAEVENAAGVGGQGDSENQAVITDAGSPQASPRASRINTLRKIRRRRENEERERPACSTISTQTEPSVPPLDFPVSEYKLPLSEEAATKAEQNSKAPVRGRRRLASIAAAVRTVAGMSRVQGRRGVEQLRDAADTSPIGTATSKSRGKREDREPERPVLEKSPSLLRIKPAANKPPVGRPADEIVRKPQTSSGSTEDARKATEPEQPSFHLPLELASQQFEALQREMMAGSPLALPLLRFTPPESPLRSTPVVPEAPLGADIAEPEQPAAYSFPEQPSAASSRPQSRATSRPTSAQGRQTPPLPRPGIGVGANHSAAQAARILSTLKTATHKPALLPGSGGGGGGVGGGGCSVPEPEAVVVVVGALPTTEHRPPLPALPDDSLQYLPEELRNEWVRFLKENAERRTQGNLAPFDGDPALRLVPLLRQYETLYARERVQRLEEALERSDQSAAQSEDLLSELDLAKTRLNEAREFLKYAEDRGARSWDPASPRFCLPYLRERNGLLRSWQASAAPLTHTPFPLGFASGETAAPDSVSFTNATKGTPNEESDTVTQIRGPSQLNIELDLPAPAPIVKAAYLRELLRQNADAAATTGKKPRQPSWRRVPAAR
eukprot:TRINITY_DN4161_c0_g1_i3.p1 TRINITY_DN4161_c0_g1~~TRINITY_DN4161_c0_g1_i3.p1  ORF type:complete len:1118 (+),score=189.80 TRINITY_DN4161_c0_g1_i3:1375-4728(+)